LGTEAYASESEALEGLAALVVEIMAALVAAAAVAVGRLPASVVAKAEITEAATATTFAVEVEVAVAGVGRFAAAAIVVVLHHTDFQELLNEGRLLPTIEGQHRNSSINAR
jgi:hypothetical protein